MLKRVQHDDLSRYGTAVSDAAACDLLIIGGGINGAAIAREAALNGLRVLLIEKGDLASGTSSASTKLIHGGLRYLEYYEFKLVREALIERERLLKAAPHLIYPMEFVLPHRNTCLLYTSPSPRDQRGTRMPSSA